VGAPKTQVMINKARSLVAFAFGLLMFVLGVSPAHAALSTELTGLVTDLDGYWGDISALILAVVIFGICIAFAKRLKTR